MHVFMCILATSVVLNRLHINIGKHTYNVGPVYTYM